MPVVVSLAVGALMVLVGGELSIILVIQLVVALPLLERAIKQKILVPSLKRVVSILVVQFEPVLIKRAFPPLVKIKFEKGGSAGRLLLLQPEKIQEVPVMITEVELVSMMEIVLLFITKGTGREL